jgi:hypothetical protein
MYGRFGTRLQDHVRQTLLSPFSATGFSVKAPSAYSSFHRLFSSELSSIICIPQKKSTLLRQNDLHFIHHCLFSRVYDHYGDIL